MRTKILLTILLCLAAVGAALAQTLTARAPQQVQEGQQFRLQYTVNTQDASGFGMGQIPDAFEVLMGPSTSTQSSYQFINGKASQSSSITYTYILCATKSGTFTIPPAHITAEGNQVNSNSLKIVVSGQAAGSHQGGGRQQGQRQDQVNSSRIPVSEKDLFIRVTASKKRVVEQEPVLLTYKVYTLVDLTQLEGKMPDLKGFHTQELPLPQQKSFQIEQLDGRSYRTVTWSQYVMFPQITGTLEIPSITYNGIVLVRNDDVEVLFRQIAGFVARRIISYPEVGDHVEQGEEVGMIKFGSRVDVFLPKDATVAVSKGDKVVSKKTVLAYIS